MKKFALIGAAGFVAPRHMRAIKENGHDLVAAYDPHDSVGVLDSYFPECEFFFREGAFIDYLDGNKVDYVSICSPNYLHLEHVAMALRFGANAICEKPLTIDGYGIISLKDYEKKLSLKVNTILQLRLHPEIIKLKQSIDPNKHHEVNLNYIAPRGKWYNSSWKGHKEKSGGIVTNIGIHLFDLLIHLFGEPTYTQTGYLNHDYATGWVTFKNASVGWKLSTKGEKPERSITINGKTLEFSNGFTDLHTKSYAEILAGRGFTIQDAEPSINLVNQIIRNSDG